MSFEKILEKYRQIVDKELVKFINENIAKVNNDSLKLNYDYIKEFVLNGGKRLRPIVLIMAYKAVCKERETGIYRPSLSVELVHNSTLVHDDIMDEDELRRNKPTIFKSSKDWFLKNHKEIKSKKSLFSNVSSRFGVSNAILNGDILLSWGCDVLTGSDEALTVLNKSYRTVVEGQILDIMTEFNKEISEQEYFEMISKKTADLFKASIQIGAILGNASEEQIENLTNFAMESAIAFQIKDDLMDISEDSNKGHDFGSDIKQGKKNILIIKTLELANEEQRKTINKILGREGASNEEINEVIKIMDECSTVDYAENAANIKIKNAKEYLKKANINEESYEFFSKLADYMVKRKV